MSDGSVVRTVQRGNNQEQLSGSLLISRVQTSGTTPTSIVAVDVETGATRWSIDVPADEHVISTGESWVLSTDTGTHATTLRRPGMDPVTVADLTLSAPNALAVGDSQGLLVSNESGRPGHSTSTPVSHDS